ncbi:hypothetical protein EVAR_79724_1 [Eumeta japonica]|uniref:Uncharacterized protein n=1 Tax=Eumeta variegata TaxID=151549 RepID=A0A4C1TA52_EUMVA|nr:hypothetical protein EVAR_79724_1 [Eumeta japonica]
MVIVDLKKEKALHQKEVKKLPKLTSYFTTTTGETSRYMISQKIAEDKATRKCPKSIVVYKQESRKNVIATPCTMCGTFSLGRCPCWDKFDNFESSAKERTQNLTTRIYLKEQDVEGHGGVFDGSAPSVQSNGKERFNVETFLPIIDTLSVHLKQRLSSYETGPHDPNVPRASKSLKTALVKGLPLRISSWSETRPRSNFEYHPLTVLK